MRWLKREEGGREGEEGEEIAWSRWKEEAEVERKGESRSEYGFGTVPGRIRAV
jgi:hypothetical protein